MADIKQEDGHHHVSQVMTGSMYDIIKKISHPYLNVRGRMVSQAFWDTISRMQRMALQPLDKNRSPKPWSPPNAPPFIHPYPPPIYS